MKWFKRKKEVELHDDTVILKDNGIWYIKGTTLKLPNDIYKKNTGELFEVSDIKTIQEVRKEKIKRIETKKSLYLILNLIQICRIKKLFIHLRL